MKKILPLFIVITMLFTLLTGCNTSKSNTPTTTETNATTTESEKSYTLKIGHSVTEKSSWHLGLVKFKELVAQKSNGRITIEIYPNLTLGSEREMIEGMMIGSVDMGLVSPSIASSFTSNLSVLDMPYIFRDFDHAHKVLDSEIGQELLKSLEDIGIEGLAFYENGWRSIATSKPISSLSDLKGMKIRTPESPMYIEIFKALGANPVPMTWGDVYTALQQKTIDGTESSNDNTYKAKMHEVAPYVTCSYQAYASTFIGMSKQLWDTLSENDQKIIRESAMEAAPYQRQLAGEMEEESLKKMESEGSIVIRHDEMDWTEWEKAAEVVYEVYKDKVSPELIAEIKAMK